MNPSRSTVSFVDDLGADSKIVELVMAFEEASIRDTHEDAGEDQRTVNAIDLSSRRSKA